MEITPDELATYLGASTIDKARAGLLLRLAVDACKEIVPELPESARGLVLDVAANAYASPPGPGGQMTAGPFGSPVGPGGITLSRRQETRLKRLIGRRTGAFSVNPIAGLPVPPDKALGLSDFYATVGEVEDLALLEDPEGRP